MGRLGWPCPLPAVGPSRLVPGPTVLPRSSFFVGLSVVALLPWDLGYSPPASPAQMPGLPSVFRPLWLKLGRPAYLPILSGIGLIYAFLDLYSRRWIISGESSSVASSSAGSSCPSSCGGATSTARDFFLAGCAREPENSLPACA
ncbi:hypothetical protein R1flu_010884 [Riccia fluitans]|uniref:Uncharacterized protein n=1 Tax=Riccia fluitans TaxID=41844 RepID=A0ABD1Z9C4_9MARC